MHLDLDALRAFTKVAELTNFTRAASQLGLSKSRVSLLVTALEARLGTRLLQRSTRTVKLTSDGENFVGRAERLLQDAEELSTMFQAPSSLRGRLRIDMPVALARDRVIPRLPEFFAAHPLLEIQLSTTDRRVDLLREGFDCVLRAGVLDDSALVVRKVGAMTMTNCASPGYVAKYGLPATLDDLSRHFVVHYSSKLGAEPPGLEYRNGQGHHEWPMRALVTVNNSDAYLSACLAGLGIVQVPRVSVAAGLAAGTLLEVLPRHIPAPLQVSIVHGYARVVPPRLRVFMSWLTRILAPHLE